MTVDSSDATSGQFTLQINGINNPTSVQQAGNWKVETKNLVGGSYYIVDTGTSTTGSYIPEKGTLTAASSGGLTVSDRTTYSVSANYVFKISLSHDVPNGGKISLLFPTDFTVISGSLVCNH